jgi:hypothetical protein
VPAVVEEDGWFRVDGVVANETVTVAITDSLTGGVGKGEGVVPEGGTLTLDPIQLDDTPIAVVAGSPRTARGASPSTRRCALVFSDPLDPATLHASRST